MTDPFTTVATVAGVVGLTLQAIKSLHDDVQAIKDAPAAVDTLKQDLDAVAGVLQTIQGSTEGSLQHLSTDANAALAAALNNCKSACETFQAKLRRWMRHSTDQHMHWWDRVRVGILAEKNVETLSKQLLQCKVTLNTAIGTMTLLTSIQSREGTQEIRAMLLNREETLKQELVDADQEITQISAGLALISTSDRSGNDEEPGESAEEGAEDLNARRASLQCSRDMFQTLFSDIHFQRTGQKIRDIEMTEGGRLLVGQINAQDRKGGVEQDISNVKASKGGKGVVGVAEGLDINSFFK